MTCSPGRRAVGLWLGAALASTTGCHAGVGPTLSYAFGAGPRLGWEAGGGYAFIRGNVGQSIALGHVTEAAAPTPEVAPAPADAPRAPENPRFVTYAAFEPFFVVLPLGATVGVAVKGTTQAGLLVGAWGGFPFQLKDCHGDHLGTAFSAALGVRYGGDITELYFAPKVQFASCRTLHL